MSLNLLKAEPRDSSLTKGTLNGFRKNGRIPASLYGAGMETELLFVDLTALRKILNESGQIFEMEAGGQKHMVKAQEIQMRPSESLYVHVAFQKLQKGVQIQVEVPLHIEGKAAGQNEGGVPELSEDKLSVLGNPSDIPESITIDITTLELNGQIHARDISLPPKIELHDPGEKVIVTCHIPKVKAEEPETVSAAATAEAASGADGGEAAGDAPKSEGADTKGDS